MLTSRKQLAELGLGDQSFLLPKGIGLECLAILNSLRTMWLPKQLTDIPRANKQ